jgi:hypothetical protein
VKWIGRRKKGGGAGRDSDDDSDEDESKGGNGVEELRTRKRQLEKTRNPLMVAGAGQQIELTRKKPLPI